MKMKSLPVQRKWLKHLYVNLIQIEWMLGLLVAYLLGSKNYLLFIISLVLCIILGYGTNYLYWKLIETK